MGVCPCAPPPRPCPALVPQELLLKRAADVAEALYSAPRAPAPLAPLAPSHPHPAVVGINAFSSPLAIAVGDATPGPEPGTWPPLPSPPGGPGPVRPDRAPLARAPMAVRPWPCAPDRVPLAVRP